MTNEKKPHPDAPSWLFVRDGVRGQVYTINYRKAGKPPVRQVIDGEFLSWRQAVRAGEKIIEQVTYELTAKPGVRVLCEDLCLEIVRIKESRAPATRRQVRLFYLKHIIPYLQENCPYAYELNATVWLNYKNHKRLINPKVTLFNHWKYFRMLFKYAFDKGILSTPIKATFNQEREDFKERGLVMSNEDLEKLLEAATPIWRERILIQRYTGMRPGEVRKLKKSDVDFDTWIITLRKEITKTRTARSFVVESDLVRAALKRRLKAAEGVFLFPSRHDKSKHMDESIKGWNASRERAGIKTHYTPHDLRHTYLTEMFKTSENPALICFQAGLSLEEATKTYLHFTAEDTRSIAKRAAILSKDKGSKK